MICMAEPKTTSDFYGRFNERLIELFADVSANETEIKTILLEMVRHEATQKQLQQKRLTSRQYIYKDAIHEVWIHVVELIPKAITNARDIAMWYQKVINCEFIRISKREQDSRVTGVGDDDCRDPEYVLRLSDYGNSLRDVRAKQRRFSIDNLLSTLGTKTVESFRRHFDDRISKAVEACEAVETTEQRIRCDAYLQALQEERRYVLSQYKKCETPLVRYTLDRRIEKESASE